MDNIQVPQPAYFCDTLMADGHILHLETVKPIPLDVLKQFTESEILVVRVSHKRAALKGSINV